MGSVWLSGIASLVIAYLLGGIPWAVIVGRGLYGTDPREHGSGNVGATNTFRLLGYRAGALVAALDIAKGFAAVAVAWFLAPEAIHEWFLLLAGIAAVLGHTYSPFIGFAGGKGVAPAAGVLLFVTPIAVAILVPVFVLVIALTRYVSAGSVIVAALYPAVVFAFYDGRPFTIGFAVAAAALVLFRHRSNLGRLIRGTEAKIDFRKKADAGERGGK